MPIDFHKELFDVERTLRKEMRVGFDENSKCHSDMKTRIVRMEEFHKNKEKSDVHMKRLQWSILTGVLMIIIGAVLSSVMKTVI